MGNALRKEEKEKLADTRRRTPGTQHLNRHCVAVLYSGGKRQRRHPRLMPCCGASFLRKNKYSGFSTIIAGYMQWLLQDTYRFATRS